MLESRTGANGFKGCGSLGWTPDRVWSDEGYRDLCFMSSYQRMLVSRAGAEGPDDGIQDRSQWV